MDQIVAHIREQLYASADDSYKDFNRSLVPGEIAPMLGVRVPKLRDIAKQIAKSDGDTYIDAIKCLESKHQAYHEELMLHGMVIGYMKCDTDTRKRLLNEFVPMIDNWAVCDSSCMTYKFMKKDPGDWYPYLQNFLTCREEYSIRFAVVAFLDHFVNEEYIDLILSDLKAVRHEGYYVKMAVAWALSVCYVKFPEKTERLFTENILDDFTHNKAIQKIRESYRVTKEEKERLNLLKRK